ncbi:CFEM domain-containing protein [Colletotrichum godetiae]|uniref:CFEM domain-containing protein n=1 Tax=Colletotrichum godetiae TaxID=1209918 RepID=A0AAJ0AT74_9PEZI|nr:CFEM domain-containing protein [Colletotrichum godetiae]KAK1689924.1 CFEM domain-containing protein [Colletotrichum godetiae]
MSAVRLFFLLACFLGLGNFVAASDISYQGIPSCAIKCIFQEIGHSSCALTDQKCMCNDEVLAGYVQVCVEANCTVMEMLAARNQSLAACGVPVTQQDTVMAWFRALLFALPTFFIIVRMVNKCIKLSSWGWDDTTIVIAYAVLAAFLPAAYLAEATGAGRDIWVLSEDQITYFLLLFIIFGMLYMTCLAFIKASIIFLYLRIFPDETFRRVLWCTQLFNLLLWIAFIAGTFGSCQPLHFFWHGWKRDMEGKCFNLNAFAMCHGVLNVALDAWMLVLPATQVYSLRMQPKKKLGVMLMFGVGVFLTAVSAYRIKALLIFATSYNVTADSFQSSLWSHIELCVGIFVSCLPGTRQVWRKLFPKILEVTHLSSRSARLSRSAKASHSASQASRSAVDPNDRSRVLSYEESSIAHLVGDFNTIDLNNLSDASPMEADPPKTPKNHVEVQHGPISGSSRSSDGIMSQKAWDI